MLFITDSFLVSSSQGMHIDKWLRVHKDSLDLRDRQLVLQQVTNFLAAVHTVGNSDRLCLWGSFVGKATTEYSTNIQGPGSMCQLSVFKLWAFQVY